MFESSIWSSSWKPLLQHVVWIVDKWMGPSEADNPASKKVGPQLKNTVWMYQVFLFLYHG